MIIAIEEATLQHPKHGNPDTKRVTARQEAKTGPQGESPYTAKNLDGAITHLEIAVAVDDNVAVFGRRYWLDRVQRMASTPQIMPAQARRLRSLLDQLKGA
ncbi:hypothetical protein C7401_13389 [Paraburkholderia unamae]|uniref:hypothetical protein n=1 Tax=Paraburkholderia unamae TaxID=219649 RepID=UPI000DC3484F|nr:hypothetical protein [Paraburkholderia unamae]RAR52290.1 hypothetical protein C7401_13389 [Paraburkholderia unamae]